MKESDFKPGVFILWLLGIHLVPYLIWVFIILDLRQPFIDTFSTNESRAWYVAFLICLTLQGIPFWFDLNAKK